MSECPICKSTNGWCEPIGGYLGMHKTLTVEDWREVHELFSHEFLPRMHKIIHRAENRDEEQSPPDPYDEKTYGMMALQEQNRILEEGRKKNETRIEALEGVVEAAKILYDAVSMKPDGTRQCPHGNSTMFPVSGCWCDDCWGALAEALEKLEEV